MSYAATERYSLRAAPAGLRLVQDLLNTISADRPRKPDLLSSAELASGWLRDAIQGWCDVGGHADVAPPEVRENDLAGLRRLRDAVAAAVRNECGTLEAAAPLTGSVSLSLDAHGRAHASPRGTTVVPWLRSAVLAELLDAQRSDVWRRLKVCRNGRCAVAFFDQSKNISGLWHDAKVCGNAVNLRASRARRSRVRAENGPADRTGA